MKIKGVKVWSTKNPILKMGVATKSLRDLKNKVGKKMNLKKVYLFLEDGTEIDEEEYFDHLDNQVLLFVSEHPKLQRHNGD